MKLAGLELVSADQQQHNYTELICVRGSLIVRRNHYVMVAELS